VNKQLWTSSYSVLTAGLSLALFLACYYLLKKVNVVTEFFSILGMNCIFL
jgi:predicted acyltransferase